ncbi:hypothetical protein WH47_05137, partial [Habropoda laboriosa]
IEQCRQLTAVRHISVRQDGRAVVTGRGMYGWRIDGLVMAEFNIDIGKLPEDVREKLAELDLELSEGLVGVSIGVEKRGGEISEISLKGRIFLSRGREEFTGDNWRFLNPETNQVMNLVGILSKKEAKRSAKSVSPKNRIFGKTRREHVKNLHKKSMDGETH